MLDDVKHIKSVIDTFNQRCAKQYEIFVNRKIQNAYHLRWKQNIFTPITITEHSEIKLFLESTSNTKKDKWKHLLFITISPPPSLDKNQFIKKMKSLADLSLFDGYILSFEQRGSTEATSAEGIHAHMLCIRSPIYGKSKIKKRFINSLVTKKIFKKEQNNAPYLMAQKYQKKTMFSYQENLDSTLMTKIDYILGYKNHNKLQKVKIDKYFRKKMKLPDLYYKKCNFLNEKKILQYIIKKNKKIKIKCVDKNEHSVEEDEEHEEDLALKKPFLSPT